ncbi:UbiA family prenyltransferase [Micromonospora polyrhachis]|uniref:4-hydroxybenzoate polyprenyltransferase n=1 Tax=Micromonospora polyrhachis TaxID=1282883 RepID=A0A7W7STM6_9ACTN|nr:UbiA family prenyltransferase [Micromonospora polyrhachis]MBB4960714.1 4-hydroxybenzoate polyprenyltransferase [Micromonospora polyrhachis]
MPSLRDLAELVRAPAALSVPGDVLAGAVAAGWAYPLAGSAAEPPGGHRLDRAARASGLAGASVLLYWAGMAANDWADRRLDALERPERPIPSGRVHPATAFGLSAGLTVAGLAAAGLAGGRRSLAVAVPLTGAVWAYDLWAKKTAAGPAVMAACRGLDVLLGASLGQPLRAVPAAVTIAAHTYTVTALSRREVTGADRWLPMATLAGTAAVAGAATGPVGAETRVAAARSAGMRAVGSGAAGAGRIRRTRRDWRGLVPAVLAAGYLARYGRAQARAMATPDAARIRTAVGAGITGLPALQGALIARAGAPLLGMVVAAAAPVGRRLARWMSPT